MADPKMTHLFPPPIFNLKNLNGIVWGARGAVRAATAIGMRSTVVVLFMGRNQMGLLTSTLFGNPSTPNVQCHPISLAMFLETRQVLRPKGERLLEASEYTDMPGVGGKIEITLTRPLLPYTMVKGKLLTPLMQTCLTRGKTDPLQRWWIWKPVFKPRKKAG